MTQYFNRPSEKEKRRLLRNNMPNAETVIWTRLKGKQLLGYKFRRQYSVDRYIVDFYCPELKLAVEIDGDSHYQKGSEDNDRRRQAFIESFGIQFLRFTNEDVFKNLEGVIETVRRTALEMNSRGNPL
ncbi:MAG: endonuclease domain-containing protein [Chloroflexi bacterium]|nr:endonuclease domain-containing protein [Chloroflexota bacterium]